MDLTFMDLRNRTSSYSHSSYCPSTTSTALQSEKDSDNKAATSIFRVSTFPAFQIHDLEYSFPVMSAPPYPSGSQSSADVAVPIDAETSTVDVVLADSPWTDQWGFCVYRTTYTSEERWAAAKAQIRDITTNNRKNIGSEGGNLETCTLKYISNQERLDGKTSQEIRLIHNPDYKPPERSADGETLEGEWTPGRQTLWHDNLCEHVCLMLDEKALDSILNHSEVKPGYVIAVDAMNEESEMFQFKSVESDDDEEVQDEAGGKEQAEGQNKEGPDEEEEQDDDDDRPRKRRKMIAQPLPFDGTMKVHIGSIFSEFYLRSVGNNTLVMGEIHPEDPDEIWRW
ncbi:hypothetical protein BDV97DRAFT_358267 [Delphinella strobiligena]|nr:hypothetical protein BDV97DRAFT_358267 [Delphinella strobiligena]